MPERRAPPGWRPPLGHSATHRGRAPYHSSRRLPPHRRVGLVAPPPRRRSDSGTSVACHDTGMAWHIVLIVVLLATGYDLYLRVRARRQERAQGGTDDLARLESRRAFYELAGREFERARRYQHPFTIAYFDLDDFREVSRLFPHQVGDEMLRLVGGAARSAVRGSDVVARLGGDQFALLLPEAGPEAAGAAVKKLQRTLQQLAEETGLPPPVGGGVGAGLPPPGGPVPRRPGPPSRGCSGRCSSWRRRPACRSR